MNWRQWFALLFFFILYLLLGAVVFMFFESPEEEIRSQELGNLRNVIYGYGHLAPSSAPGRLFCIFFALIGIPLNGILFAALGDHFGAKLVSRSSNRSTAFVVLADVLLYFIPGLVVFLVIPAGLFAIVEGWNYTDSFYYAFITLTTIGFGDLVAGQNDVGRWTSAYRSFIIIWILFGLGYLIMVINIITKGLRSRSVVAPVVALERRMAARIRATRKALSKDAIALRQLVNQIRVLKIKPIGRPARKGLFRTYSQPSLYSEGNIVDKDPRKQFEATGSNGFGKTNYIDRDITCNNGSFRKSLEGIEFNEDPVQLLTRLASALCDENEDDDLSSPDTSTSEIEHTKEINEVDLESTFQRIRRSLHLPKNSRTAHTPRSPAPSPKVETDLKMANVHPHRFAINRRLRHVSENHDHVILNCDGSMKSKQRLMLNNVAKLENPHEFKRSFSERFSPNRDSFDSSFQFKPASDCFTLKLDVSPTGTISNADSNTQTDLPNATVIEFCHILDRVQVSRENSASKQYDLSYR
ncbi:hypothetical protein DAPPUDRAFT_98013 [Daphnia pulex]|uniref:Potassium channel domain-containing protein n=1 Tax=Daphnia pulex TaxID=6669 RepID=E9G225_DAPPU|nr:hypothetical protein DAPPUDRAFT_98013 [Daphnia pulex]|eukprot:EFX86381.1 hypothetical protein DAPPUDRAFT_98013 [Daphnia pulex]